VPAPNVPPSSGPGPHSLYAVLPNQLPLRWFELVAAAIRPRAGALHVGSTSRTSARHLSAPLSTEGLGAGVS